MFIINVYTKQNFFHSDIKFPENTYECANKEELLNELKKLFDNDISGIYFTTVTDLRKE